MGYSKIQLYAHLQGCSERFGFLGTWLPDSAVQKPSNSNNRILLVVHFVGENIKCGDVDFPALSVVKLECEKEKNLAI